MRCRSHAACRASGAAERKSARPCLLCFCWSGKRSHGTSAQLFHRTAAFFTVDRDFARWATCLHDAAARYRIARGPGHCGGVEGCLGPVLCETRCCVVSLTSPPVCSLGTLSLQSHSAACLLESASSTHTLQAPACAVCVFGSQSRPRIVCPAREYSFHPA